MERIQRLATRLVKGFRRLPCEDRLRRLGLHSLRRRRLCADLRVQNAFWRIGHWAPSSSFFPPVWPGLRGHTFKFLQGLRRKSSFSTQVVKYWNRLLTLLPRSLEIVFDPFMRGFSASAPRMWYASPLAKSRCRYQPSRAN